MSYQDDEFPDMLGSLSDFESVEPALPDDDGLIEAPLIPLRDMVLYPQMVTPLFVGRPRSMSAMQAARAANGTIICAAQMDADLEEPKARDIYRVGVEVAPGRTLRMPDGTVSLLVQGIRRIEIVKYVQTKPYIRVKARIIEEPTNLTTDVEASMRAVLTLFERCVELNRQLPEDAYLYAMNIDDPGWLADLVASTLSLDVETGQSLLEIRDVESRLMRISVLLGEELRVLEIEDEIHSKVQQEVDKTQREMLLREQIRAIQTELGESDLFNQEVSELKERFEQADLPDLIRQKGLREISRLAAMPPMAPEMGIIRSYLDWLLELPWDNASTDNLDISHADTVLNSEHFGLDKAKERVIEHIAVRKLAADRMKTPILCFAGPPGTGKTSLGRSIASALGREFVRVSLGGVTDEAEMRGHRRTYIGAMPGRIIQTMRRAGTINPVFMLDEIDKLGSDYRGDPSSALLEVLDPEQNHAFSDHYLEVDYDLSRVFFITTANSTYPIPSALQDRLEIIEFPGYVDEEKVDIAKQFLIPRQLEAHGLQDQGIRFDEKTIRVIIREFTYEAGVRNLEREIANICRKLARRVAEEKPHAKRITPESLPGYLGPIRVPGPILAEEDEVGMAHGLVWTEAGGDITPVEVSLMPGKGSLTLTGQLGEVLQESAQAALSYTRSRADIFRIDPEIFDNTDIHIHMPEGAIPKDGPSAGITLATALVSAFTEIPIRHDIAMTGEITLKGRVLPVGGIKEKVLAAHRVNIRNVILPARNIHDLDEIPRKARRQLNITLVDNMDQVLDAALALPAEPEPEKKPKTTRKKTTSKQTTNSKTPGSKTPGSKTPAKKNA